jgi:hypothetical protein
MTFTRTFVVGFGLVASAQTARAQPNPTPPPAPPAPAPAPPPSPNAPPDTPPSNFAPPLPAETAPPEVRNAPAPEPAGTPVGPKEAEPEGPVTEMEVYGFTMLDIGYDFGKVGDPKWDDTLRPTKLPAFEDEYGKGGRTFASVRQTRFGVKAKLPTSAGDINTKFEFEMFGTGADAGQTTIRLRHAYGEWNHIIAGQTWSPFMDIDVFPNSVEYWGPPGMAFYRNVQLAWQPITGDSRVTVALERPGGSADVGSEAERIELMNVVPRLPAPDVSAEGRYGGKWGYVEAAGIFRYLKWDDLDRGAPVLDGHAYGWGVNLSSNIKLGPATIRLQGLYGRAIENYMNDATVDIGVKATGNPAEPIEGVPLPILGLVAMADINWNKRYSTAAGWSFVWMDNSEGQTPDAYHMGHYALANLMWHPTDQAMIGGELQYGRRANKSDGFTADDVKIQFSFKYNFSKTFGGNKP